MEIEDSGASKSLLKLVWFDHRSSVVSTHYPLRASSAPPIHRPAMELALRLGDRDTAGKDLGFCMAIGTTKPETGQDPPVQLDLLPVQRTTKFPFPFPWLNQNIFRSRDKRDFDQIMNSNNININGGEVASYEELDQNGLSLSRKKRRLSKQQSAYLQESFKEHSTLNPKQKAALAKQLNLHPRQVEVWFQNRRARTKLKQTEVDCEYLKGCCEMLTEENWRLQKEVQELRALKASQPFYMHLPPTTLTMCPSCERVVTTTTGGITSSIHAMEVPKLAAGSSLT